jgi:hypothetical protein
MSLPSLSYNFPNLQLGFRTITEKINALINLVNGVWSFGQSVNAPVVASSGTINTAQTSVIRIAPTGAVTGAVLQPGTSPGQLCVVLNESAFSVTFAASGTSNVADGASDVIAANTARTFFWDSVTQLWYPSK